MICSRKSSTPNPNAIQRYVASAFGRFGLNKQQQISRLLYEISKRDGVRFDEILNSVSPDASFKEIKSALISRRYPALSSTERQRLVLPHLNIKAEHAVDTSRPPAAAPEHIVIENSVKDSELADRIRNMFPQVRVDFIERYRDYRKGRKFGIKEYNERLKTFFIVREYYDIVERCPCSSKSVSCQLHITHLGSGCAFDCAYCYLPDYINYPGIVLPANIQDFFTAFQRQGKDLRVGSGELTDSLVFDHITGFSSRIVDFFRRHPNSIFEFKTKSTNIQNLLSVKGCENVVVAWSVNPQCVVDSTEFFTASITDRITAAQKCVEHGYRVAFHFDPLIHFEGWEDEYRGLVDEIFTRIPADRIETVSLGTLRMSPDHKKIIENRFPDTYILDGDFIAGHDGKLRYPFGLRTRMYSAVKNAIESHGANVPMYLCMEEKDACMSCETAPMKQFV